MDKVRDRFGLAVLRYVCLSGVVFLAGCAAVPGGGSVSGASVSAGLDTVEGLAAYLRDEPAVRGVEPWENPYGDEGLVISTRHYRLYTTLLEPLMLRQIPSYVESAFRAYQSQLPAPLSSPQPFIVYLFGTREEWEAFTVVTAGSDAEVYLQIQAGAYVANGVCAAYDIGRRQTFSVLGHEGWHQFNQRLFVYRLPSWLDEGIATLFETCRYEQGRFVFNPGSNLMRLGTLKRVLEEGRLIPLEQLLLLNPGQVLTGYSGDPDGAATYYAQVYAMVRFLREERYGVRLRNYHAMLLGAADGAWPLEPMLLETAANRRIPLTVGWNMRVSRELFDHYFDEELQSLNDEYAAFCRKITYRVRLGPR